MTFEDFYIKICFFKDDIFFFHKTLSFFQKKLGAKKHMFLRSIKQNKNFYSKVMYASLRKKNAMSLVLLKTLTWAHYGYRYSPYKPGFDQSILKIFAITANSLFAK